MLDLILFMEYDHRYKDYVRQAQKENLLHVSHPKSSEAKTFYRQALGYFGRLLLNWGWRLQAKRGDFYTHSRV